MRRRILLVDDEVAILLTMRAILEMSGFEVETASSASEAEEKLRADGAFQMVITDMKMERDTAGFDVVRAVRNNGCDAAIAILTAHPDFGADWKKEGADSLWIKPIDTAELLGELEDLLAQHKKRETFAKQ